MSLKIVVLAKQVPDTRNVGKDAMKADGTINRAALPAIFNPEDLNALEQALRLKDAHPGSTVTILTMGPGRAADIIREGLFRGADNGYLLTDRAFAGADTLATSYALATAIRKIGDCDIIIGGRQAIDGDTAQVGPQVAEKLGLTQITYAEEILEVGDGKIKVKRHIDGGVETVEGPLPIVITVNGSAAPCRPRNAKLVQKYKHAKTVTEKQQGNLDYTDLYDKRDYLNLVEWSVADVNGDLAQCGLSGSPTKVKAIQNIVFQAKESKIIMNNLFVYCEIEEGNVADVSLELLTKGRSLANQLNCQLEAVVAGSGLKDIEKQILPYGVDKLHVFDGEGLYPYTSLPHTAILVNLFKEEQPQICLMGATVIGRDLGPRVSSALTSGLTADCTSLEIGDHEDKKEGKTYKNLLYQIRPAFGGNIVATIVNPEHRPQMATVREGVMKKEILSPSISGQIQHIAGMQESGIIISINNDPDAPINTIADYVINGSIEEVVPKMIKYYKQNSK